MENFYHFYFLVRSLKYVGCSLKWLYPYITKIKEVNIRMINNKATITGMIETQFLLDHEYYNEKFYQCLLSVKRTSGTPDTIPIIVSERLIDVTKDYTGCYASITGEFRSFNAHHEGKTSLILYIFPLSIDLVDEPNNINDILLQGVICKTPVYRETPQGRLITDVLLAVNREYNKTDYIPCIAWGRNAYYLSTLSVGTTIRVTGRVQSRKYNKNGAVNTAYEFSINLVEEA